MRSLIPSLTTSSPTRSTNWLRATASPNATMSITPTRSNVPRLRSLAVLAHCLSDRDDGLDSDVLREQLYRAFAEVSDYPQKIKFVNRNLKRDDQLLMVAQIYWNLERRGTGRHRLPPEVGGARSKARHSRSGLGEGRLRQAGLDESRQSEGQLQGAEWGVSNGLEHDSLVLAAELLLDAKSPPPRHDAIVEATETKTRTNQNPQTRRSIVWPQRTRRAAVPQRDRHLPRACAARSSQDDRHRLRLDSRTRT